MLQRVLVATDFSQGATAALDRALRLPLAPDAVIEVLHVSNHEPSAGEAATQLERELVRARSAAPVCSARLVPRTVRGSAYVEIIRAARTIGAELAVVGVHGARWFQDLFIGSTAARVVRKGDVPVLLVRQPASAGYRRPLVAAALEDIDPLLFRLARRIGVERPSVVHAVHIPYEGFRASTAASREALRAEYCEAAAAKLQRMLGSVDPGARWTTVVHVGDTRSVVLGEARRIEADLVICGTHARSGIAHALVGSVAETLIAMAPCDVLVTRPTHFTFELP